MTIVLAAGVMLVMTVVTYKVTQIKAGQESSALMRYMNVIGDIMSPNIQHDDLRLVDNNLMGGKVVSHRYKEIEGQRFPWSTSSSNYSWLLRFAQTDLVSRTSANFGPSTYDQDTQQKIPSFYNLKMQKHSMKVVHEVKKVAKTKDAIAEVALTFKRPLTYAQIQAKLPQQLHATWYWLGAKGDTDVTYVDNNYLGFSANPKGQLTKGDYIRLRGALEAAKPYHLVYDNFDVFKFAWQYAQKYPKFDQAPFAGVIVTGNSADFQKLVKANWVVASSAGIVAPKTRIK
ncbi:ECF-type sigma factor negative effector [Levilactobacillus senmaizukei DSM 21775 = NBRC 103853]|uniref:ECF-type sigma factor negative effector n=2 Tax=Levilactobacillus senmaizukei TaxID=431273 RepID=A0A0R2DCM0_9LACO|nr:ECF-type sigma factor negative effector [Levilactobacillus senmaizukei DSM 21775 = NBRC 103853]